MSSGSQGCSSLASAASRCRNLHCELPSCINKAPRLQQHNTAPVLPTQTSCAPYHQVLIQMHSGSLAYWCVHLETLPLCSRPVLSFSAASHVASHLLFDAAAAPISEPDVPRVAHVWVQQSSQCVIHVPHVTEQWLTQLQLPLLPLVLAAGPLLSPGRPLHAGSVCCFTHLLLR